MKKFVLLILLISNIAYGGTWIGGGVGIFFPIPVEEYSYSPGGLWKIAIQHNLSNEKENYFGFVIGIEVMENDVSDFVFQNATFPVKQNEIQLGIIYNLFNQGDHRFEVSAGYVSKGIEISYSALGVSQSDPGFFIGFGDKYMITDYFLVEGNLNWSFVSADTNWGNLTISGPKLEILIWLNILNNNM